MCDPCSRSVLLEAINRIITCSPHQCHREVDCFVIARELKKLLSKSNHISAGDSLVDCVCEEFQSRSFLGQQKYGFKMTRDDLSLQDWIKHLKTELMDAILYAEAALRRLEILEDDGK